MHEPDDHDLLRQFAEQNSETAFAALVARHVDKVYSVALRHTRNAHAAEEITQAVFVILAKKSGRLGARVILAGWLYETARLTAVTYIRSEIRRARREQEAHMQTNLNCGDDASSPSEPDTVWPHIAPLLDDALAGLSAADRHAVVLRYFDGKSLGEVGAALGASEDAAKKRVTRAVEKLRGWFTQRGVTLTVTVLTAAISANSVQAAPLGLAATVTATAVKGAAVSGSTLTLIKGALKIMAWTKMKTAVVVGVGAVLVGTSVYQAQQAAKLREQNLTLQQAQAPLADQIQQLQRERDAATKQLADLQDAATQTKNNNTELLKLRGRVTQLANSSKQSAQLQAENDDLQRKVSELQGRWFNVTNAPQFSMPYLTREMWTAGTANVDDPMQILMSAAASARDGDADKLAALFSADDNKSLIAKFSKERWQDVQGIQIVTQDTLTSNGQETCTIDSLWMRKVDVPSDPGTPTALRELMTTHPETHRLHFLKTDVGWKLTAVD